jgi:peptidoglycan/xylan/chitin deacetylase (PgdA/CDA1 family)
MRHLAHEYAGQFVPLDIGALKRVSTGIMVTFDDGYRDNLSIAAPLLVEFGIPFTVFVCTGAVAQRRAGFLGPDDVRELASLPGARIGSHSVMHARLTECDDRTLQEELSGSKIYLEDLLGSEVDALAYPYGAVNRRVRDLAERSGYRTGVTCRLDVNPPGRDRMLLCRTTIFADDEIAVFDQKLKGKCDWYRWRHADPTSGT